MRKQCLSPSASRTRKTGPRWRGGPQDDGTRDPLPSDGLGPHSAKGAIPVQDKRRQQYSGMCIQGREQGQRDWLVTSSTAATKFVQIPRWRAPIWDKSIGIGNTIYPIRRSNGISPPGELIRPEDYDVGEMEEYSLPPLHQTTSVGMGRRRSPANVKDQIILGWGKCHREAKTDPKTLPNLQTGEEIPSFTHHLSHKQNGIGLEGRESRLVIGPGPTTLATTKTNTTTEV